MNLVLPWPTQALSPNARVHWRVLAKAKKGYRFACAMTAQQQGAGKIAAERISVHLRFVPPDRRRRDLDNCIASMKAGLDGLADVLGVDDSRWTLSAELPPPGGEVGGMVKVEVQRC